MRFVSVRQASSTGISAGVNGGIRFKAPEFTTDDFARDARLVREHVRRHRPEKVFVAVTQRKESTQCLVE